MTSQANERVRTVSAASPSDEFRSVWTDLRGVSFSQGWLDVDGIRTRFLRSGDPDAPKIILIPGTGGHAEVFAPNLGPLGEHFDCWAIDLVGHGYTDKPDVPYDSFYVSGFLDGFLRAAGIELASFVGISVGVLHALRFTQEHRDKVDRLVLVTPFGAPMPKPGEPMHPWWCGDEPVDISARQAAADRPSFEIARDIIRPLVHHPGNVVEDIVAARFDSARQPGAAQAYRHVMWWTDRELRLRNTMTEEELAKLDVPALEFVGAEDAQFVPMGQGLVEAMPNARMLLVEGTCHWPNYEDPELFNRYALEFLLEGR